MVALIKGVENKIKIVLRGLGQGVRAGWPARGQGDGERRGRVIGVVTDTGKGVGMRPN